MKVGDMIGYSNGDGSTGIVLARWIEAQPGIGVEKQWCEVLWDDGIISDHNADYPGRELEKIQ